jgi:Icc protein
MLDRIEAPWLVIPGNHDEREAFRRCFADQAYVAEAGPLHFVVGEHGPMRVIGLDVTVPGAHHGDMDDAAVLWLERALALEPDRPTMIMMHQPPVTSGIPYIDAYCCQRGDRLAAIVARFPAVQRVLCGHIHRSMQLLFGGTLLCTAPSTTSAIALRLGPDAQPASYIEPPAMLLHRWVPDGACVSHCCPIGAFPGPFPFF